MTERTLRISARMTEEIQQWASDELSQWPRDTAYAADLESLLAQLTEQPALAHIAAAACTCGHCGGLVCCQNCGTPPQPAPDAVAEAATVLLEALHSDEVQRAVDTMHGMLPVGTKRSDAQIGATFFLDALAKEPRT